EISFIQGKGLDKIRILIKNIPYLLRYLLVSVEMGIDKNEVGAELSGGLAAHRTAHPVLPRLITGCRNDPPFRASPNSNGLAFQLGMVELLHGGVESVHVHMDDLSKGELVFH